MKLVFKITSCLFLCLIAVLFSAAAVFSHVTSNARFDPNKLTESSTVLTFYDETQTAIPYAEQKQSIPVKLDDLPPHTANAFIAIEDKRFYSHKGIDYRRIAGAALNNVKSKALSEGASTISQQLIKNTHLSGEKTLKRKLKEIKLTSILERRYSKKEILQAYLNTIYFGEGAYGIERAAQTFFNISATDLSVAQSALLAAVIKAPSAYSPYKNEQKALHRRNTVINCMLSQGYISKVSAENAKAEPIAISDKQQIGTNKTYLYYAKNEVEDILHSRGFDLYDSYQIVTYLDTGASQIINEEISDQLKNTDYCGILIDNKTHSVKAIVSSCGMFKRSPASTVKPWLIYAPCIDTKTVTSATKICDEPTDFNGYKPTNYGDKYYGYVSVKEALSKSLNIPAVKLADSLGINKIKEYANKMNVSIQDGLGVALGSIDEGMTLKEICDCYSVFLNEGSFFDSVFVKKITDSKGKTVYEHKPKSTKVFQEGTAYIINDALKDCAVSGTAKKLSDAGLSLQAKTGTNGNSAGNSDAYCISYSPTDTLGIWLGNKDNSPMPNNITGGTYPTIISSEIWKRICTKNPVKEFKMPNDVCTATLNERIYTTDYLISPGEDGPTFPFLKGTEPKETKAPSPTEARVSNVKQSCIEGNYTLRFSLEGFDGADVVTFINGRNKESKELTGSECEYRSVLKKNKEYYFVILPYFLQENSKKVYGEKIILPAVKYINKEKNRPPKTEWWADD